MPWKRDTPGCDPCECGDADGGGPPPDCETCGLPAGDLVFAFTYYSTGGLPKTISIPLTRFASGGNPCRAAGIGGTGGIEPFWAAFGVDIDDMDGYEPTLSAGIVGHPSRSNFFFYCSNVDYDGEFLSQTNGFARGNFVGGRHWTWGDDGISSGAGCAVNVNDVGVPSNQALPSSVSWSCPPLCFIANYQVEYGPDSLVQDVRHAIYDPADPPTGTVTVGVTVRGPACAGDPGAVQSGVTVALDPGGLTAVTGMDGRAEFAGVAAGDYTLSVDDGGCEGSTAVSVSACSGDIETSIRVCCAVVCVVAKDAATLDPIEGVQVAILGHDAVATDAAGIACIALTTAEMLALPSPEGGACSTRLVPVVLGPGPTGPDGQLYLPYCPTIAVECGASATDEPQDILLYPLDVDGDGVPDYAWAPEVDGVLLCGAQDCHVPGYAGHGLLHLRKYGAIQAEVQSAIDGAWYSLMGGAGGAQVYDLDTDVRAAISGGSAWETEFGESIPNIAYYGHGTSSFSPDPAINDVVDACTAAYSGWQSWLWHRRGVFFRHLGPFGSTSRLPGSKPSCAEHEASALQYLEYLFEFDIDLCYDADPWERDSGWVVVPDGGGLGQDLRWRVQVVN